MSEPNDIPVFVGSGNVFKDLGFEDAEELTIKGQLAFIIRNIIKRRRLTQLQAALVLGIDQPKVSALLRYRVDGFSLERLLHFLRALGVDVEIKLTEEPATLEGGGTYGRLDVVAVA